MKPAFDDSLAEDSASINVNLDNSEHRWSACGPRTSTREATLPQAFLALGIPSRPRRLATQNSDEHLDAPPPLLTDDDETLGDDSDGADTSDDEFVVDDRLPPAYQDLDRIEEDSQRKSQHSGENSTPKLSQSEETYSSTKPESIAQKVLSQDEPDGLSSAKRSWKVKRVIALDSSRLESGEKESSESHTEDSARLKAQKPREYIDDAAVASGERNLGMTLSLARLASFTSAPSPEKVNRTQKAGTGDISFVRDSVKAGKEDIDQPSLGEGNSLEEEDAGNSGVYAKEIPKDEKPQPRRRQKRRGSTGVLAQKFEGRLGDKPSRPASPAPFRRQRRRGSTGALVQKWEEKASAKLDPEHDAKDFDTKTQVVSQTKISAMTFVPAADTSNVVPNSILASPRKPARDRFKTGNIETEMDFKDRNDTQAQVFEQCGTIDINEVTEAKAERKPKRRGSTGALAERWSDELLPSVKPSPEAPPASSRVQKRRGSTGALAQKRDAKLRGTPATRRADVEAKQREDEGHNIKVRPTRQPPASTVDSTSTIDSKLDCETKENDTLADSSSDQPMVLQAPHSTNDTQLQKCDEFGSTEINDTTESKTKRKHKRRGSTGALVEKWSGELLPSMQPPPAVSPGPSTTQKRRGSTGALAQKREERLRAKLGFKPTIREPKMNTWDAECVTEAISGLASSPIDSTGVKGSWPNNFAAIDEGNGLLEKFDTPESCSKVEIPNNSHHLVLEGGNGQNIRAGEIRESMPQRKQKRRGSTGALTQKWEEKLGNKYHQHTGGESKGGVESSELKNKVCNAALSTSALSKEASTLSNRAPQDGVPFDRESADGSEKHISSESSSRERNQTKPLQSSVNGQAGSLKIYDVSESPPKRTHKRRGSTGALAQKWEERLMNDTKASPPPSPARVRKQKRRGSTGVLAKKWESNLKGQQSPATLASPQEDIKTTNMHPLSTYKNLQEPSPAKSQSIASDKQGHTRSKSDKTSNAGSSKSDTPCDKERSRREAKHMGRHEISPKATGRAKRASHVKEDSSSMKTADGNDIILKRKQKDGKEEQRRSVSTDSIAEMEKKKKKRAAGKQSPKEGYRRRGSTETFAKAAAGSSPKPHVNRKQRSKSSGSSAERKQSKSTQESIFSGSSKKESKANAAAGSSPKPHANRKQLSNSSGSSAERKKSKSTQEAIFSGSSKTPKDKEENKRSASPGPSSTGQKKSTVRRRSTSSGPSTKSSTKSSKSRVKDRSKEAGTSLDQAKTSKSTSAASDSSIRRKEKPPRARDIQWEATMRVLLPDAQR
jgi:hypothetical protein